MRAPLRGSSVKCGLPPGWMSPIERSTRCCGTSRSGTIVDATIEPALPFWILPLRDPLTSTGSQPTS